MEKKITVSKALLKKTIREAIEGVLNTDTNNTMGGDPKVNAAIELMENWEWVIDQVSGNFIYAHLGETPELEVVVEVRSFDGCVREVHYTGDEFDNSYCIDLEYLVNKLAELDI